MSVPIDGTPAPSGSKTKKIILTTFQVAVTVGILYWQLHDPNQRAQMGHALAHAKPSWLLLGFLSYGIVEFLAGGRWYVLLRVQNVKLPLWRVGALFMLGIFFNMFMPGGTGGDLVKIYYLMKEIPDRSLKSKGFLAVLMDRLVGLVALIMISGIIVGIQYHWLRISPVSMHLTWVLLAILVCGLSGIIFSFIVTGFGLAHKLPQRMPGRDMLIEISVAYNAYARQWPATLAALFCSYGVHFASFFVYCCAARALSIQTGGISPGLISMGAVLTVMPIILTLASMPVSVGGTGVREGLFVALLGPLCGVPRADAFALSITGAMLTMVWGMIGGLIYLLYRPSDHPKFDDIAEQVVGVHHAIAEEEAEHEKNASSGQR